VRISQEVLEFYIHDFSMILNIENPLFSGEEIFIKELTSFLIN
jgi:hypothetical protein